MADDGGGLAGFVEIRNQCVNPFVVVEGVHRSLAAGEQRRIVVPDTNVVQRFGFVDQLPVIRRVDEAEAVRS
jgi:hypothetical protein